MLFVFYPVLSILSALPLRIAGNCLPLDEALFKFKLLWSSNADTRQMVNFYLKGPPAHDKPVEEHFRLLDVIVIEYMEFSVRVGYLAP